MAAATTCCCTHTYLCIVSKYTSCLQQKALLSLCNSNVTNRRQSNIEMDFIQREELLPLCSMTNQRQRNIKMDLNNIILNETMNTSSTVICMCEFTHALVS